MKALQCATLVCLAVAPSGAAEHRSRPAAFFGFALQNTSLEGEAWGVRPDEEKRLAAASDGLREVLVHTGCCSPVSLSPVAERAGAQNMQACGGCEIDLAREVGAEIAILGWVQKVSNLILNMNVVIREVATGRVIDAHSVDIRGNTDESWSRALSYLVRNGLHPADW